jgi:prolyl-tRNA editing enzyme YbaK/EbsC (Cys-tRNA(Pro) deacylase)
LPVRARCSGIHGTTDATTRQDMTDAEHDPADPAAIEARVRAHLDALAADYDVVEIDPAFANTAAFCERYGYPEHTSGNCILVASKTGERKHVACVVPATMQADVNRTVRKRMGVRKVSFAPAEETVGLTGMLPDGVTPFGLPEDVPVYVAEELLAHPRVIVGGGSRRCKIEVDPEVFTRMPQAEVVPELARRPPG